MRTLCLIFFFLNIAIAYSQSSDELYAQAKTYYYAHPDSVVLIADMLEKLGDDTGDRLENARASHLRGVHFQLLSQSDSGLYHFQQMESFGRSAGDTTMILIAQLSEGLMFVNMGAFDSAMVYYTRGESLATAIGEARYENRAMAEIARVLSLQGKHEIALEKSRAYYQNVRYSENANDLATAMSYLAVEFMHFHNHDSSLYYLNKALPIQKKLGNLPGLAAVYINKGSVFQEMENTDSAIYYYEAAGEIYKRINFPQGLGQLYLNLSSLKMNKRAFKEALSLLEEAMKYSIMIGDVHALSEEKRLLADAYFFTGQSDKAYMMSLEHQNLEDSLLDLEKSRIISELEAKYETEKKEQQIALQEAQLATQQSAILVDRILINGLFLVILSLVVIAILIRKRMILKREKLLEEEKTNTKEAQIKAAITSQEKERSRFAKDLHDGFGQMISILNLNLKSLETNPDSRHEVFDESAKVLEEMYQELKGICFNLMPQTLINHGIGPALNEFASRINISGKVSVVTDFFGLEERLTEVQEISLYRITQEWVNNIIKYSDADRINIQITKDEEELTLMVEDNGLGFDQNLLKAGKGNGWRNMNSRANLIKGELELDTSHGIKGNTLIVNAPVIQGEMELVD